MLCEHPECLAKKFVVFPSEAELKVGLYAGFFLALWLCASLPLPQMPNSKDSLIYDLYGRSLGAEGLTAAIDDHGYGTKIGVYRCVHIHISCNASELTVTYICYLSSLQRHNATTHGGHMSRSQRNAALQVCQHVLA